jgi:hypothetical protein
MLVGRTIGGAADSCIGENLSRLCKKPHLIPQTHVFLKEDEKEHPYRVGYR